MMLNISNTMANDSGKKIFQQSRINWSIRYRGNEARTQIKKNNIPLVLRPKTIESIRKMEFRQKDSQPPINMITVNKLIKIIDAYSAKKNKAKPILEYSTLKPETNSDSASGKSNGARFVSANIEIKNIKNKEKNGIEK